MLVGHLAVKGFWAVWGNIVTVAMVVLLKDVFNFYILTNSVAQEPESSSPHSQQPATGPCPETVESNPHPPQANLPKIHSDPIFPPTPGSFQWLVPRLCVVIRNK
jgi:hypothetical protein